MLHDPDGRSAERPKLAAPRSRDHRSLDYVMFVRRPASAVRLRGIVCADPSTGEVAPKALYCRITWARNRQTNTRVSAVSRTRSTRYT